MLLNLLNITNFFRATFFLIVLMLAGLQVCETRQSSRTQFFAKKSGDVQIFGVFPISSKFNINTFQCSSYSLHDIQLTQAMIYAIDELINGNPNLLPGIKVGWTLMNSCTSRHVALASVSSALTIAMSEEIPQISCQITPYSYNDTVSHFLHSLTHDVNHESPSIGLVGAKTEPITASLASFTSSLSFPQISYNSFSTVLKDRATYPYFFRTTPPIHVQANAIADILAYFQWNWVSIVIAGSDNVDNMRQTLFSVTRSHNICISLTIILHDNYTPNDLLRAVNRLKLNTRSKIIIVVGEESIIYQFLLKAQSRKLTGKTFIGTYGWLNMPNLHKISGDILGGAIGVNINRQSLKKFLQYLKRLDFCNNADNPWFVRAWYRKLLSAGYDAQQVIDNCDIDHRLRNSLFNAFYELHYLSAFVMDSVLALAHALHTKLRCNSQSCPPLNPYFSTQFDPEYLAHLKNVTFDGIVSDKFTFRPGGSSKLRFNIVNLQPIRNATVNTVQVVSIGNWNEKERLTISADKIVWNGGHSSSEIPSSRCSRDCQPGSISEPMVGPHMDPSARLCCWTCKKCPNDTVSSHINQRKCHKCSNYTTPNKNKTQCEDMVVEEFTANEPFIIILSIVAVIILLYFTFAWVSIIIYRSTPIVKGSNFILLNIYLIFNLTAVVAATLFLIPVTETLCKIQIFIVSISEIGVLSTIICKTNQIDLIFKKAARGSRAGSKLVSNISQVLSIVAIQIISNGIIAGMMFHKPNSVSRLVNSENRIELTCKVEQPALISFYVIMATLCVLAVVMAFRTRKLPDNFNEAHYIFLAALLVSSVSVISIPTALVTVGLVHRLIVCVINLSFGSIALLCLISPKLYVIYFQSDLNTRQQAVADIASYTFNNNRPNASPMSVPSNDSYLHQSPIAVGRKVLTARVQPKTFSEETDQEDL